LRKNIFWIIIIVASLSVFSGFWALYSVVSQQYEEDVVVNEQFLTMNINLKLEWLMTERNMLLDHIEGVNEEFITQARQAIGNDLLYAAFFDPDGTLVGKTGEFFPENFNESIFYETVLYSYGNAISEIALSKQIIHLQTAKVLDDGSVALLGTKFDDFLSQAMQQYNQRHISFFYGKHDDFISNKPLDEQSHSTLSALFLKSMNSQRPESQLMEIEGVQHVFTALPIFDADHWDVKGYLTVLTPFAYWQGGLFKLRNAIWIISTVSMFLTVLILFYFFREKMTEMNGAKTFVKRYLLKGFLAFLPAIIAGLLFLSFLIPQILDDTTIKTWEIASPLFVGEFKENSFWIMDDLQANLRDFKKINKADYTVYEGDKIISSTISERMLKRLSERKPFVENELYQIGMVNLNKVEQKFLLFPVEDKEILITREVTEKNNIVLSLQFYSIGLCVIFIMISLMVSFLIVNIGNPIKIKKTIIGYAFLAPALIHLIWWAAGPMAFSLFLAFRRWSVVDPAKPFVGLANFIELFQDGLFWNALKNTAIYSLHVPLGMIVSLLLAMAVNKAGKVAILLRVLYYLPVVTAGVATTIVWRWIFNRDFGMLNYFLSFFGLSKVAWLDSPQYALGAIMLISIWGALGSQMLIFLAGLQGIPKEFYDAASVDGANKVKSFRYITLPLLKPTSLFVLVTSVIGSFQVFTPIYVLTEGGPLRSTDVVFYHIWESAWVDMRMGYAAAQSWILFFLLALLTLLEFKLFGKDSWKSYN